MCYNLCLDKFVIYIIHLSFVILVSLTRRSWCKRHRKSSTSERTTQKEYWRNEWSYNKVSEETEAFRRWRGKYTQAKGSIYFNLFPSIFYFLVVSGDSYLLMITFSRKKLLTWWGSKRRHEKKDKVVLVRDFLGFSCEIFSFPSPCTVYNSWFSF